MIPFLPCFFLIVFYDSIMVDFDRLVPFQDSFLNRVFLVILKYFKLSFQMLFSIDIIVMFIANLYINILCTRMCVYLCMCVPMCLSKCVHMPAYVYLFVCIWKLEDKNTY